LARDRFAPTIHPGHGQPQLGRRDDPDYYFVMTANAAIDNIDKARTLACAALRGPGDWLSGDERAEVWHQTRASTNDPLNRARRQAISPEAVAQQHPAGRHLSAAAVDVVHRVASDPGRLTRPWAEVGVTAIARTLDCFDTAIGVGAINIGATVDGSAAEHRPDDVGEVGAWVPQTVGKKRANVSRALSLVPATDSTWRALVDSHYSRGAEFMSLVWDRALSRVQVEAVAARTTSELDCFY